MADVFRSAFDDVATFEFWNKPDFLVIWIRIGDPPDR